MSWLSDLLGRRRNGEPAISFPNLPTQPATVESSAMTQDEFRRAAGISSALAARWYPHIDAAMRDYKIDTPLQKAHFIAQVGHESASFTRVTENLNYSVAGLLATFPTRVTRAMADLLGRSDAHPADQVAIANLVYGSRLGNRAGTNDGWLYRGRGLIQTTGRSNYKACGEGVGVDFENQPEKLAEDKFAALSAGWYWQSRNVNAAAERDDLKEVRRLINGGSNGIDDCRERLDVAKAVLCG